MAFWGIEVSPGNSYTHRHDQHCGRLRITQATLGMEIVRAVCGKSKSVMLQCTVGKRRPIFICSLIPGEMETSSLELEFEEIDDVVFSVIGSRSVHVSGYFMDEIEIDADGKPPNSGASCSTLMQTYCSGEEAKVENKRKKKKSKKKKKKAKITEIASKVAQESIKEKNVAEIETDIGKGELNAEVVKEKVIEYEYEYEDGF